MPGLMAAGFNVAIGHDCVMDLWYGLAQADMLEVAHTGPACGADDWPEKDSRLLQRDDGQCGEGDVPADYGPKAIRLRANRLKIWRKGKDGGEGGGGGGELQLVGRPIAVGFSHP